MHFRALRRQFGSDNRIFQVRCETSVYILFFFHFFARILYFIYEQVFMTIQKRNLNFWFLSLHPTIQSVNAVSSNWIIRKANKKKLTTKNNKHTKQQDKLIGGDVLIINLIDVVKMVTELIALIPLRGYCTPDQFCDCLCLFL